MKTPKDIVITPVLEENFWRRVVVYKETGCWLWTGPISNKGYGLCNVGQETYLAHRVSWCIKHEETNTPIGKEPDHLCRVRPCVNWDHLEIVT
jgi:hypothetical protein